MRRKEKRSRSENCRDRRRLLQRRCSKGDCSKSRLSYIWKKAWMCSSLLWVRLTAVISILQSMSICRRAASINIEIERRLIAETVFFRDVKCLRHPIDIVDNGTVRDRHAFWHTGGTGCKQHIEQVRVNAPAPCRLYFFLTDSSMAGFLKQQFSRSRCFCWNI